MPTVSEANQIRAKIQDQPHYNTTRGWVLCGFWLFVFALKEMDDEDKFEPRC
jgi:hypothetical protein